MRCSNLTFLIITAIPSLAGAQSEAPAEGTTDEAPITELPTLTRAVEAEYPKAALRDRISARVVMAIDIDVEGFVENVEVVSSSTTAEPLTEGRTRSSTITDYGFEQSARVAAAQLEFTPAKSEGTPVPVRITYTYNFELPAPKPTPPPPPLAGDPTTTATVAPSPGIVNFRGLLRERGNRRRVPGVVVTVFQGTGDEAIGYETITESDGTFEFRDLQPGRWKVLAEAEGYYPVRDVERIEAGKVTDVTYYIEKGTYSEYDVLVEGERIKKEVNRVTLTIDEITKVPGTLGDPILVVENLPGVARPQPGSGQIIVRGSGPQDTGVFVDGIEVPLIFHFGGLKSVLPAEMVDNIEFYPGNFSTYYGRFTGGVFDAHIKRLDPDQVHGSLDISILDTSAYLEVPITDELAVAVAGRRSYVDAILEAAVPSDSNVNLITAPRYYDYQALINWRPNPVHEFRLFGFGSDDALELLFENPSNQNINLTANQFRAATDFQRLTFDYRLTPSKRLRNYFEAAIGRDKFDANLGDLFFFELTLLSLQVRNAFDYDFTDSVSLRVGFDGLFNRFDVRVLAPPPQREGEQGTQNPDFVEDRIFSERTGVQYNQAAGFAELTLRLFDQRLTLVPGVRLDYLSQTDSYTVDPRVVARMQIGDAWTVKGGVGLVAQPPEPVDLDEAFGTPDLGVQRGVQYSIGGEYQPLDYLKFDVTLFYKDLVNLVSRSPLVDVNLDNNGVGRVYGVEVYILHKFNDNFRGWLTYTLNRAERRDSGEDTYRLFDFDQTHILNLVASYLFAKNWEFGVRWRLVSGNPNTSLLVFDESVFDENNDGFSGIRGPTNGERFPIFHQLDLRIDKTWIFDTWRFSAYLSLINTYNRGNVEGFDYGFDFSSRQTVTGLPVLPIIGMKGAF